MGANAKRRKKILHMLTTSDEPTQIVFLKTVEERTSQDLRLTFIYVGKIRDKL